MFVSAKSLLSIGAFLSTITRSFLSCYCFFFSSSSPSSIPDLYYSVVAPPGPPSSLSVEAAGEVTKKSDLSDFYFNLGKNVAFGANNVELMKPEKPADSRKAERQTDLLELEKLEEKSSAGTSDKVGPLENLNSGLEIAVVEEKHQGETSTLPERQILSSDVTPVTIASVQGTTSQKQQSAEDRKSDHHKRNGDAVAAAKERFLARKRAKQQ